MDKTTTIGMNQNDLNQEDTMENSITKLMAEVDLYKQAIQDAKDALASAEQELDDTLAYEYERQGEV